MLLLAVHSDPCSDQVEVRSIDIDRSGILTYDFLCGSGCVGWELLAGYERTLQQYDAFFPTQSVPCSKAVLQARFYVYRLFPLVLNAKPYHTQLR